MFLRQSSFHIRRSGQPKSDLPRVADASGRPLSVQTRARETLLKPVVNNECVISASWLPPWALSWQTDFWLQSCCQTWQH